ncbi:LytR/AlgR family response regulator transcription factor [Vibrio neptunius]|uniref:Response regulator transcription factor n=1 Tax=Vibrio neptunius TaxID=170651 RepID=A0ABS3A619_9VIBR|nr:LytTR family DNA-binding domain-containing protein [Vibrio neptunius]MBN3493847.1 response regulator transcription factor [Vibrio neptunius]MBN3516330.1 response regulator transcription factor [Vibrio neptunius]MBN3550517.1 response regulator transcription factor [Vibrio neptunius]MBN3578648.1 response regulator transcription factor [Vibrio neptunius]MCH9872313.1 response regulator transcription factor [Vibrio neptunius]
MQTDLLTAVIADDEPLLRRHLNQALAEYWPELDIVGQAANGEQALEMIEQHQPQVVFLDIKMPGLDGMSLAKKLSKRDCQPHIVFVTAYDEYAVQAFETNAVDYLLKPVSDSRLTQCVEKLKARLHSAEPATELGTLLNQIQQLNTPAQPKYLSWIRASKGEEIHLIALSEVLYFKAEDKYVSLYKREQGNKVEYVLRTSLKELLAQLDPELFWQVHRSSVVNVSMIDKVKKDFTGKMVAVMGDDSIPISRAMQSKFTSMW